MSHLTDIDAELASLVPRLADLRAAQAAVLDRANDVKTEIDDLRRQGVDGADGGPSAGPPSELSTRIGRSQDELKELTDEEH